jgi:hypothetical protein
VKCAACQQAISDRCVEVGAKKWHPEVGRCVASSCACVCTITLTHSRQHFTCSSCGTPLAGKPFKEDDGDVFCSKCKDARRRLVAAPAGMCGTCKQPIVGEFVTLRGQRHHPKCVSCCARRVSNLTMRLR